MTLPGVVIGSQDPAKSFIPEIWSGRIIDALLKTTVMQDITNEYYQGEVQKYGDKVHIDYAPVPNVYEYHRGQNLQYDLIETPETQLNIDKGVYFAAEAEDVIFFQTRDGEGRLRKWTENGGRGVAIAIDRQIINDVFVDVDPANAGSTAGKESANVDLGTTGTPFGLTSSNILDKLVDAKQILDEQNVPEDKRWIVLPAWAYSLLLKADIKNASFSADGGSTLTNGKAMNNKISAFNIYVTNSYQSVIDGAFTAYHILFGHVDAITFAKQIEKTETLRAERTFADLVRSLCVYGYKTIQPKALGDLYAYKV